MSDDKTPEERLKKYKELLARLEKKQPKESGLEKTEDTDLATSSIKSTIQASREKMKTDGEKQKVRQKTAALRSLVSPSKRELEDLKDKFKTLSEKKTSKQETTDDRRRLLVRVRLKTVKKSLQEIREKRQRLERKYQRGFTNKEDYERALAKLVSEGHKLLSEKKKLDEEYRRLTNNRFS